MYNARSGAIRWQIFTLSVTVYEIFANEIKCQKFDLAHEGHGRENWSRAVRLEMLDST